MKNYKKSLKVNDKKEGKRSFYKIYEKGKDNKKNYKGSTIAKLELSQNLYLNGVSCFIIDEKDRILIEKRANTKLTANEIDLCSGHIDNNETQTQTMIREYVEELHSGTEKEKQTAREEAIQGLKKLDELDLIFTNKGKERKFFIQFYMLKTKMKQFTKQEEEVQNIEWVPYQECFELIRQGKTKFPYDERYDKMFKKIEEYIKGKNIENNKDINIK